MTSFTTPYSLPTQLVAQDTSRPVSIYRGGYMEVGSAINRSIAEVFVRAPALRSALASAVDDLDRLIASLPEDFGEKLPDIQQYRELLAETPVAY